jgi:hypothetical protein
MIEIKNSLCHKVFSALILIISVSIVVYIICNAEYLNKLQIAVTLILCIGFLYFVTPFIKVIQDKKTFWDAFLDK